MKRAIYELISFQDEYKSSPFNIVIFGLILISIVLLIVESINPMYSNYKKIIDISNSIIMTVFVIEYILRIYISELTNPSTSKLRSAFKFIFSFYGLIDLLALLPFLLPFVIRIDFRFLRILRAFKFFRILKLNRYLRSIELIKDIIVEKRDELLSTFLITFFMIFLSGFLMYYIENPAQPDIFSDIPVSMWWAVATLTTVGYGDIYPITAFGKFIGSIISLLGIGVVALPTGIISVGYLERLKTYKNPT